MSIMCWATVFAASSQLMRSHWLPGLAPTRFMGYLLRLGWYSAWMPDRPFGHMRPFDIGSMESPLSLMTRPLLTVAMTPQFAMQARQDVRTSYTSLSAHALSLGAMLWAAPSPSAPTAPVTAAVFMNERRVIVVDKASSSF